MDPEMREALDRLERGVREDIEASTAATHRLVAETRSHLEGQIAETRTEIAETRSHLEGEIAGTRSHFDVRITESEDRTRRHFDVVGESLRGDIRSLAEGVMAFAEGSIRRDAELGGRIDRLDHRVLGLESRVSLLESPRPRRRRRR